MKKFLIFCSTALIPFFLVWIGFILTAFSYSPREIFQGGAFWGLSCIYWFLWICMSPLILEIIDETHCKNNCLPKKQVIKDLQSIRDLVKPTK